MKKTSIGIAFILVLWSVVSIASANSWGLTGPLLNYVMAIKDFDDYSAITEYYSKDCRTSAAVMGSRYHHILLVYGTDASGNHSVWRSTTAVWQPGEMDGPISLTCTDDTITLKTDTFSSYTFSWDQYENTFILTQAEYGEFVLTLRDGVYYSQNGKIWQAPPIDIQNFNVILFPRTEYDILRMNRVYAVLADASGLWHGNVVGTDGKKIPVYSAPDTGSYRAAKGKAIVNTAENFWLLASIQDWDLVEYEVSMRTHRIGWINKADLSKEAPVMFTDVPAWSVEYLTDDPFWSQYQSFSASQLRNVHLLGLANPFYAYASAETAEGQPVWGFVPVQRCSLSDDTIDEQIMADLCGAWVFYSGGDIACEVMLLHADGTCELGGLKNEMSFEQLDPTNVFSQKDYSISITGTWYVADNPVKMGLEKTFVLKESNGKIVNLSLYDLSHRDEDGRMKLILVSGEAGGTYVKVAEENKPLTVSTVELSYTSPETDRQNYGVGYENLEEWLKPFFPEKCWNNARFLTCIDWEKDAAHNEERHWGTYKHYPVVTVLDGNVQLHLFNVENGQVTKIAETRSDCGMTETNGRKATAPIYHLSDATGEMDGIYRYRETLNLYFSSQSDPWNIQIVLETEVNNDPDILWVTHVIYQYSEPKTTLIRGQKYDYVVVTPTEKGLEYSYGYCEEPISDSFLFPFSGSTKLTEFTFSSFTDDPDKLLTPAKIDTKKHGSGGKVKLRQTPDKKGKVITEIPNAAVVNCTDIGNGWCFVHYQKFFGYIMAQYIEGTDAYSQR